MKLKMTDNIGIIYTKDGKMLKLDHYRGAQAIYIEVVQDEYDKRVYDLANQMANCPGVDLVSVIRDALYDLPLERLGKIEKRFKETPAQEVKTEAKERGTCVDLTIGGKSALNLRA